MQHSLTKTLNLWKQFQLIALISCRVLYYIFRYHIGERPYQCPNSHKRETTRLYILRTQEMITSCQCGVTRWYLPGTECNKNNDIDVSENEGGETKFECTELRRGDFSAQSWGEHKIWVQKFDEEGLNLSAQSWRGGGKFECIQLRRKDKSSVHCRNCKTLPPINNYRSLIVQLKYQTSCF